MVISLDQQVNNWFLMAGQMKNKKIIFVKLQVGRKVYHVAANGAAKKFLRSKKLLRFAAKHNIEVDLEENSFC